jgi:hypothetical protein
MKGFRSLVLGRQQVYSQARWIQEQEERRKTGFAYVDIRTNPYNVPDK